MGKVVEEMTDWSHRPLVEIYAAVFIHSGERTPFGGPTSL